jgi:cytochrome c peroxidase
MRKLIALTALVWIGALGWVWPAGSAPAAAVAAVAADSDKGLNAQLAGVLAAQKFTGTVQSTLEDRLGRRLDAKLADLGRLLWFDKAHSLRQDNTCAGCHSPTNGFGDTQSIAIGADSNGIVGPGRAGVRNQRRSPFVVNTAFLRALMWNGRFNAPSRDPFDNSKGFVFPPPEGTTLFPPNDPIMKHLLQAQAHIPPTELVEVAGFTGTRGTIGPRFDQFDDGHGLSVPLPDGSGFRNEPIRQKALQILNAIPRYRKLFGDIFPRVRRGDPIDFNMFGLAIAEFEFTLTFADAPIDQFARGNRSAMSAAGKRGALLFFGKAACVKCHAVSGDSNEMFTDFKNRVIGVPQIAPFFGAGESNMIFDGPGEDEDFGLEQISGKTADRYKFRTAPLRNVALAPAFFHNGAFTRLEDAIRHHLDVFDSARGYDPAEAGVDQDLRMRRGPIEPVLARLDPLVRKPINLTRREFQDLVEFVGDGLLDKRAKRENLCRMVPPSVPSDLPVLTFQGCQ